MAAGRIKGITIEIGGDTTKLTKALSSVDNAIRNTQTNIRDLDKALKLDPGNMDLIKDKQKELAEEIRKTEEKLKTEKEAMDQLKNSDGFDENSAQARNLQTQIDLDTASLKQLKDEAKNTSSAIGSAMQAIGGKVSEIGDKIKDVGDKISGVGRELSMKVSLPIAAAMGSSVKEAVGWESAFTGVMKTVDETATTTYDDLKKDINEIAKTTASSQNQIAATMEIGGQLGVAADDISEFTRTMIMLGDTTNLSAEEAASSIARFANVTGMSIDNADKLGSVIVDLGNNYATTEADIMSMAQRLSGAGSQIGLSEGEILGFATALSSVGIEAEMGGSAFSKAMTKMQVAAETGYEPVIELEEKTGMSLRELELLSANNSKDFKALADSLGLTATEMNATVKAGTNLEDFAEVANMSTDQFVRLYRDDAPAALQAFIQGLGDVEGHGESTITMLQDMGFTEVRLRDTLTRLAQSGDLVTDAVERGNVAWEENTAMQEEADKRYGTMESKMSQLNARLTEVKVTIGEMLMPIIEQAMGYIEQLIEQWNSLDEEQQKTIITIAGVVAAVGPALMIVGTVISSIGTIVSAIGGAITAVGTIATFMTGTLVPAIGGVIAAAAPIIASIAIPALIAAAIVAAVVLIVKNWDKIKETAAKVFEKVKEAWEKIKETTVKVFDAVKEKISKVWEAVKTKVTTTITNIKEGIKTTWEGIKTFLSTTVENIKTKITTTFENIKTGITTTVGNIKNAITTGFQGAIDFITSLPQKALQWGADIIGGLVSGIQDKIASVGGAAGAIAEKIADYIHFSEPEEGPLSNFHTFMPDMMTEIVKGINKGIPKVESAMSNLGNAMLPNMQALQRGVTNNRTFNGGINITVNGAPGQDVTRLVDIIQERMNTALINQEACFT